jgi:hypothetical protein
MKIELITDIELPGAFLIKAETPEDALIMRHFANDRRPIHIANSGGSIERNEMSILIAHYDK